MKFLRQCVEVTEVGCDDEEIRIRCTLDQPHQFDNSGFARQDQEPAAELDPYDIE